MSSNEIQIEIVKILQERALYVARLMQFIEEYRGCHDIYTVNRKYGLKAVLEALDGKTSELRRVYDLGLLVREDGSCYESYDALRNVLNSRDMRRKNKE